MTDQQYSSGKFVCATCLEDEALQRFVGQNGNEDRCDYCTTTVPNPKVVALDIVVEEMKTHIRREWCSPSQSDRGMADIDDFMAQVLNTGQLFKRIGFEVSNPTLMSDLMDAFGDRDWCRRTPKLPHVSKRWIDGWRTFQHLVKYERRYTFWHARAERMSVPYEDAFSPSNLLKKIKAILNKAQLVRRLAVGELVWRVRVYRRGELAVQPCEFTSPPLNRATKPNRMSPAGVPMFYGAEDFDTAYHEVVDLRGNELGGEIATGVQFKTVIPLNILDLTASFLRPSYFGSEQLANHEVIEFLHDFAEDLSTPIGRRDRELIDYVPTQVFTEFVRYVMRAPDRGPIYGMKYFSSWNERPCYVLFATQAQCLPSPELPNATCNKRKTRQMLEFVPGSMKTVEIP